MIYAKGNALKFKTLCDVNLTAHVFLALSVARNTNVTKIPYNGTIGQRSRNMYM